MCRQTQNPPQQQQLHRRIPQKNEKLWTAVQYQISFNRLTIPEKALTRYLPGQRLFFSLFFMLFYSLLCIIYFCLFRLPATSSTAITSAAAASPPTYGRIGVSSPVCTEPLALAPPPPFEPLPIPPPPMLLPSRLIILFQLSSEEELYTEFRRIDCTSVCSCVNSAVALTTRMS